MFSFDLRGRTALVTGGASGIGLETAHALARAGAQVAINFLPNDDRGPAGVAAIEAAGGRAVAAPGDLGKAEEAAAMVADAVERLGGLDLLVNNAGTPAITRPIPIADLDAITEELWSVIMNTNLMSVFRCSKAAAPALKASKGAIVNTASIAGISSVSSSIAYSASKAAVINLTKNLSRALAPDVRVNAVAPGSVASTWMVNWNEEEKSRSADGALLKRVCVPADIVEAIVYLGFYGSMITGQILVVDGGVSL
jgi:NAD(P)-dependent dehydrogenase (short-subunit alcohol dehydrogenase family)